MKTVLNLLWITTIFYKGIRHTECWTSEGERDARANTHKLATYDRLVRPSETMRLEIGLNLLTINYLDIKNQQLSTTGWLTTDWEDERLKWNTATYDAEHYFAYDTEIWKPELFVDNALDDVSILNDPYLQFRVENTGVVEWELPRIFVAHCDVDIQYFPFDKQECVIELTSWAYSVEELVVIPLYEEVKTEEMQKNGEWSIRSTKVETRNFTETKPSGNIRAFSVIDFTIIIKRDPSHYISSVILPILAISFLSILVFLLPVESGEKVGYTLTVLLAEAVLLTLVQDSMPSSSQNTSYLSVYLAVTLVLGVICVMLTVLVIRIYHRSPNSPVPKFIKSLLLKFCIPASCWSGCCCNNQKTPKVTPTSSDGGKYIEDSDNMKFDYFQSDHLFAWTEIAAVMDWFFFVLMCSVTSIISFVLILIVIIGGLSS